MMINLANYEFVSNPAAAIMLLHKGIPKEHQPLWKEMGVNGLYALYKAQSVSTGMVLKMLEEAEGANPSKESPSVCRQYGTRVCDRNICVFKFANNSILQLASWCCTSTHCSHLQLCCTRA